MAAIALEIHSRSRVLDGRPFGAVGPYEKIAGVLLGSGSTTAHAVIIAKARAIPTIVGLNKEDRIDRIADGDHVIMDGERGEIVVRGNLVMPGYYKNPEATAEVSTFGWHHTGDVGKFDKDGYLYIHDRIKDMIVTGGENVYSAEVENALSKHPAVGASAVIGIPSEQWGESVHAVVVCKPGQAVAAADLRDGDSLRLGNSIYRFLAGGSVEAAYHEEIHRLAVTDPLTGTWNRRHGEELFTADLVEARMAAMQAQVEPHFLFNTLASIDHLIETDPPRASIMQKNLIALLRASMPTMREANSNGAPRDLAREMAAFKPE